jgi:Transketolase, pyrimidine binding domain
VFTPSTASLLGEDGPLHQPIEHLAALGAIPNLIVILFCSPVSLHTRNPQPSSRQERRSTFYFDPRPWFCTILVRLEGYPLPKDGFSVRSLRFPIFFEVLTIAFGYGGARMALLVRIGFPRFLKPRSAHQPHFHELCQDHVAEQREEKDWPIKRWQMSEA